MIVNGTFTSVWEEGILSTLGTLDTETGEVSGESTEEGADYQHLIREYFTDLEGNEYEICTDCHSFIMKTVVNPDPHSNMLVETSVCKGECQSW